MELTDLQKNLICGMKSAGCDKKVVLRIMMALPTERHEMVLEDWMAWHIRTYGDYPKPELYPKALKIILAQVPMLETE